METKAQHIMVDLWLDEELEDHHLERLKKLVEQRLTVVQKSEYQFEPHGTTLVWILAESHFAVHTYPEHKYLSFDIYICNLEIPLEAIVDEMLESLPVKFFDKKFSYRGHKYLNTALTAENQDGEQPFRFSSLAPEGRQGAIALLAFSSIVAMCSLLYELLLAQTLATTMGNTVLRYNVTIGLYIASMGLGALIYPHVRKWWHGRSASDEAGFITIEASLGVIGVLAPILVLVFDSFFQRLSLSGSLAYHSSLTQIMLFTFNHSLIVLIGVISGLELPLLMDMAKKIHERLSNRVLAFDYFGTLVAALIFPLFLVPFFSTFTIAAMVAGLNALVALIFMLYRRMGQLKLMLPLWFILAFNLYLIIDRQRVHRWIVDQFYFIGGL